MRSKKATHAVAFVVPEAAKLKGQSTGTWHSRGLRVRVPPPHLFAVARISRPDHRIEQLLPPARLAASFFPTIMPTDEPLQILRRIEASQSRTEAKLDTLLQALGDLGDAMDTEPPDTQPLEPSDPK